MNSHGGEDIAPVFAWLAKADTQVTGQSLEARLDRTLFGFVGRSLWPSSFFLFDDFVKSRQGRQHKLSCHRRDKARESAGGGQVLRNEAYREVRCNDER